MLYFIHHPSGPVVILTTNPYILLAHRLSGWSTTPSWSEVLEDHPEWRAPTSTSTCTPANTSNLFKRILGAMGAGIAIVPGFTPAGVQVTSTLLVGSEGEGDDGGDGEMEGDVRNTGPVHFFTAVERTWYTERGLKMPLEGWTLCTEGDRAFDYWLEDGAWELEEVPGYDGAVEYEYEVNALA
jgi:hypothetical protein